MEDKCEQFDLAFSFAGEDREIVEDVYNLLKDEFKLQNLKLFYDNDNISNLWGQDLYKYLRKIYRQARFVACFISQNYSKKIWTNLEFTAIKERMMSTLFAGGFLLPIIIESSPILSDIPSYFGYITHKTAVETAKLLSQKLSTSVAEDIFKTNMNNFIDYLNNELFKIFDSEGRKPQIDGHKFEIEKLCFSLEIDSFAGLPCLAIKSHNNKVTECPLIIITWARGARIIFQLYHFDSLNKVKNDLSVNDLIYYLADYIRSLIWGIAL